MPTAAHNLMVSRSSVRIGLPAGIIPVWFFGGEQVEGTIDWKDLLITFALVGNNVYCALHGNDIIEGFPEPEANNIESLVIEGSSLFFQGMSDIMKLFDEGEKGD